MKSRVNITIFIFFISFVDVYAQFTFSLYDNPPSNCSYGQGWANTTLFCTAPSNTQFFSYLPGEYTLTIPLGVTKINYAVYAGGGGGGGSSGSGASLAGGGGSGGYISSYTGYFLSPFEPLTVTPGETISITVGSGGLPGYWIYNNSYMLGPSGTTGSPDGGNGYNSSISGSFGTLVATGGVGAKGSTNSITNDAYSGAGGTPNGFPGGPIIADPNYRTFNNYNPTDPGIAPSKIALMLVGQTNYAFPPDDNHYYGSGGRSNGVGAYNFWNNVSVGGYLNPSGGQGGAVFITYENPSTPKPTVEIHFSFLEKIQKSFFVIISRFKSIKIIDHAFAEIRL